MGNRRFIDNAPESVVAREKERLETHEANVQRLREQRVQLEQLGQG
jgi:valyl-tRNA synthetase